MKEYDDNEFLSKVFGFMGKENFVRFINITSECCDKDKLNNCDMEDCGNCYFNYLLKLENQ